MNNFDHDAFDAEASLIAELDEDSARMEAEFDAREEAQLRKLDEIKNGDWPDHYSRYF